jgi:hypothetical protein
MSNVLVTKGLRPLKSPRVSAVPVNSSHLPARGDLGVRSQEPEWESRSFMNGAVFDRRGVSDPAHTD